MSTRTSIFAAIVTLVGALWSVPGWADIDGFQINEITGLNGVSLDEDRFVTGSTVDEDHLVNYKDCLSYLGLEEGEVIAVEDTEVVEETTVVDTVETTTPVDTIEEVGVDTVVLTDTTATDTSAADKAGKADDTGVRKIEVEWIVNDSTIGSQFDYSIMVGSCSESQEVDEAETDSCWYIKQRTELEPYITYTFQVPITDLLGYSCDKGDTGQVNIYVFIQSSSDETAKASQVIPILFDYDPPAKPTDVAVGVGEKTMKVTWEDDSNTEDVTYKVYWDTEALDDDTLSGASSKSELTAMSYGIENLAVGTTYYFGVVALDDYENESTLSDVVSAAPVLVDDGFEHYVAAGGSDKGGFCFVATASYGSPLHPAVGMLRDFRDQALMATPMGQAFVHLYYATSPELAATIATSPVLKDISRIALLPLVLVAGVVVATPPWLLLLLLLGFGLWLVPRRARARKGGDA